MKWMLRTGAEVLAHVRQLVSLALRRDTGSGSRPVHHLSLLSFAGAVILVGIGLVLTAPTPAVRYVPPPEAAELVVPTELSLLPPPPDLTRPVREIPVRFPARSRLPKAGEGATSVSIDQVPFDPDRDLVTVHDARAWWESEHDRGDTEDDHQMHRSIEIPLRRLIELVSAEGGTLKIQDAYRASGIHSPRSLHKQGRAIDLTCDELGLERLAALTWAAGFDWVYYEAPKRGGHHVHASVRP